MVHLFILVLSIAHLQAVTWTYVTSDGTTNLRQRIDQKIRNFRVNNHDCKIDEIVKRGDTDETRALICDMTSDTKVTTIASCTTKNNKVTNVNIGDLSFINGTQVHSIVLICE
jgi:hypothetical protein